MMDITLLQASETVMRKSAEMAASDPHGFIITIVSVTVVFVSLTILYFAYNFIGKCVNGRKKKEGRKKTEAYRGQSHPCASGTLYARNRLPVCRGKHGILAERPPSADQVRHGMV